MYETETFATIIKRMLSKIDRGYDTREGSIIYDTLAPYAMEEANFYSAMEYVLEQINPRTMDRQHLVEQGDTYGLTPVAATHAILDAEMVMEPSVRKVAVGTKFTQGDLNFIVTEWVEDTHYLVMCEQAGEIGNSAYGLIQPVYNINGLKYAAITGVSIPGTDVEDTEAFRKRYLMYFQDKAFGWNMAQYKQELMKIQGVGGAKIIRHFLERDFWVGVIIIDSRFQKPTEDTVAYVQEILHPILPDYEEPTLENSGDGLVAIGHCVKVEAVKEKTINVALNLECAEGASLESLREQITQAINDYFLSLNETWADSDHLTIRTSGIELRLLDIPGVNDCYDTELNGERGNAVLAFDEIPVLGTITEVGS